MQFLHKSKSGTYRRLNVLDREWLMACIIVHGSEMCVAEILFDAGLKNQSGANVVLTDVALEKLNAHQKP